MFVETEEFAAGQGVRLVSFDRPGYGGSAPAPFGLASIGADAHAVADRLSVARFATLGMSGGGPGALAAATVPGGRVTRAGIASGAGPFGACVWDAVKRRGNGGPRCGDCGAG